MPTGGLSSGDDFLRESARKYFAAHYQNPSIILNAEVAKELAWNPSMHFKINDHLVVIAEVSETPYPRILYMRRMDVLKLPIPIAVYCVCPEEAYVANQPEAKKLMNDGYGLLTVAQDGTVQKRAGCIPLIQQIMDEEFANEIKGLPPTLRRRLVESFDKYKVSASSGTADIAEIMEGLILKAGKEAAKKKWISVADAQPGSPAKTLLAMQSAAQFKSASAAIGSSQFFMSVYRNASHHFPKNKKQAAIKYRECRHAFLDGLKRVQHFRDAMRNVSLSGTL